ncbi:hypothetical protein BDF19DRAFT_435538 [Syncephalis fuscata]|nr:hypothetical protein BDF19DRAFT_435538 [Syncephalis fuscata]
MLPTLSVTRPVPVNAVRSAAMRNAAYLAHVASAHSSGANTPLRPASPFLSSNAATHVAGQSKLYRQYCSTLTSTAHLQQQQQQQQQQQHQQQSSPVFTKSQFGERSSLTSLKPTKKSRKTKRSAARNASSHTTGSFPGALLRFVLLHLPLAMFAGLQLCIALIVAPFLLMLAIGVACSTAFLAALLDMWNPRWWRLIKENVSSMLRPARNARRTPSPVVATNTCKSPSSEKTTTEEKPLYEQLIDDERRRVRDVTEKLRASRRQQAATFSHLPSAANSMGASLVTGLACSVDSPPSYNSLPVRRQRPATSNLRLYKTAAPASNDTITSTTTKNNGLFHTNCIDRTTISASYRDAAAELAAVFNNKQASHDPSITSSVACGGDDGINNKFTSLSAPDQTRRPDRVGMSRMA